MFGDIFTPEYIESLIQESNAYYGATNIDVTNVAFVHGSIDPWHAMGRLTDVNEKSPAFIIDGIYLIIFHLGTQSNTLQIFVSCEQRIYLFAYSIVFPI